jgi:acetylornithine deacetylase/succinyl-diaminopimelate desuccinylase-like protein
VYKGIFREPAIEMGSMPGHDIASIIRGRGREICGRPYTRSVPAGMIFVRGMNGGVSHNPQELTTKKDIQTATYFLCEVVTKLAV